MPLSPQLLMERMKQYPFALISMGIVLLLIMSLITLISIRLANHTNDKMSLSTQQIQLDQKQALTQLNRLDKHVFELNNQFQNVAISDKEIQSLHAALLNIQKNISFLMDQANKANVSKSNSTENQTLLNKLNSIQNHLKKLETHPKNHLMLATNTLPFNVVGIDIWNDQPMATIKIKQETALVAINESYAGWRLTHIDFDASYAIFKNAKNQTVKAHI